MNYKDWNRILGEHFFKPENAGGEVFLYLTKSDLIKIGEKILVGLSADQVWQDYIDAIVYGDTKKGKDQPPFSPIERPLELYNSWNRVDLPPFIAYLVLYIIPLTETYEGEYRVNNYYGKVTDFFRRNSIVNANDRICNANFKQISFLWNELENWSIMTKDCALGIFELRKFGNSKWIHVGKPFSQCLLPPNAIKRLPIFFFETGLVPNSSYSRAEFRDLLIKNGNRVLYLKDSVLSMVKKGDADELGQTILDIVLREYENWTGESHDYHDESIKSNFTVLPLFLQLKVSEVDECVDFSYRGYSSRDFPEDLKLGIYENIYYRNGWTKILNFEFQNHFEVRDDFNKWTARFPSRDIRLFENASKYQLSPDYWIETRTLARASQMYLLCRRELKDEVEDWGKSFAPGDFQAKDFEGLPPNFLLYRISRPTTSHPRFSLLTLYSKKSLKLIGGIRLSYRTFVDDILPQVEIVNSTGLERPYLQYRGASEERLYLEISNEQLGLWQLPDSIERDRHFLIRLEDEELEGKELTYCITTSNNAARSVVIDQLPKRDPLGNEAIGDSVIQYCQGSNVYPNPKASIRYYSPYCQFYLPVSNEFVIKTASSVFSNHAGNMLASYLTKKAMLNTEEFYEAFEAYFYKVLAEDIVLDDYSLSKLKRESLTLYDFMGILDYDYERKRIVVNPAQLIFIPTKRGRAAILIGARDRGLIDALIENSKKLNINVEIVKQFDSNKKLLLPDVLKFSASGERSLERLADLSGIEFSKEYFPQIALLEYSASIVDYENSLLPISDYNSGWAKKIFNPETLRFEKICTNQGEELALIEYKLNEYTYFYLLSMNGVYFKVDRNWGRYLILNKQKVNIILYDSENQRVGIPIYASLPRLLSESLVLLSGIAPNEKEIEGRRYRIFENIQSAITHNLFLKLGQQPIKYKL